MKKLRRMDFTSSWRIAECLAKTWDRLPACRREDRREGHCRAYLHTGRWPVLYKHDAPASGLTQGTLLARCGRAQTAQSNEKSPRASVARVKRIASPFHGLKSTVTGVQPPPGRSDLPPRSADARPSRTGLATDPANVAGTPRTSQRDLPRGKLPPRRTALPQAPLPLQPAGCLFPSEPAVMES